LTFAAGKVERIEMRSPLTLTLFAVCSICIGCNARYEGEVPTVPSADKQPADNAHEAHGGDEAHGGEDTSASSPGWPAGDDPAQSFTALAENIRSIFEQFETVEETKFYPLGFTKLKRVVSELEENLNQQADSATATIHVVYTKNFSLLHETRDEAKSDNEVYPLNPAKTLKVMQGKLNPKQNPIKLELTYTLQGNRWIRTGLTIEPAYKDTSKLAAQMRLP